MYDSYNNILKNEREEKEGYMVDCVQVYFVQDNCL